MERRVVGGPDDTADREPLDVAQASVFGRFLASLHRPPPPGVPRNDYRGVPLAGLGTC